MLFFGFVLQMSSLMDQPMTPFGRRNKDLFPKLSLLVPAAVVLVPWLLAVFGFGWTSHNLHPAGFSLSARPVFSDFDGDHKLDQAELSSRGRFKTIYVTLGKSSWRSLFFDSVVSDKGRLVSGDLDNDGDDDLIWMSQGNPEEFVIWLGDGRGDFSIATKPEANLHRIHALLNDEAPSGLSDNSTGRELSCALLLAPVWIGLLKTQYQFHIVSAQTWQPNQTRAASMPYLSVLRKRGPPSELS